jgi:hypothetical protein
MQRFLKAIPVKAHRWQPRLRISGTCAVAPASPHLHWTVAITGRLGRRSTWRGIHPEDMTLSSAARLWILLRQIVDRSHTTVAFLPLPAKPRHQSAPHAFTPTPNYPCLLRSQQTTLEPATVLLPTTLAIVQDRIHQLTKATLSQSTRTIERIAKVFLRVSSPITNGESTSSPLPPLFARRTLRSLQAQESETDPTNIPAQVQRRHRRIEQRPFLRPGDSTDPLPALRTAGPPVVIEKPHPRIPARTQNEPSPDPKPISRASQPGPPLNIGQITDAVLQQLDRRLVAARERVGRT